MVQRKHTATRRSGLALAPALLMLTAAPALADVKAGVDAWSRGEFAGAVKEWLGPAAKGDADAQFNMGQAFKLGKGVPQDTKRAEAWYRKAASQGHIKAADTLGLLMFQDGRKADALPFLQASAERGEPRAQYILGIAHFNGDIVGKDWVRAYALMSRAASAGLEQATRSLATMDGIVPLEQRQLAMSLSADLEQKAQENRSRQFAAADLGVAAAPTAPLRTVIPGGALERADIPPSVPSSSGPVTAGADFANPVTMPGPKHISVAKSLPAKPVAAAIKPVAPTPKPAAPKPAAPTPAAKGNWRVQLGAFGVKANADGLWTKLRGRAELAGHGRIDLASGSVTRLLAGGFGGQAEADKACAALRSGGFTCLVVKP
ncbi:SPOR domain-containing protein [Novosphingobium sp. MMS21-SN21R]|uniref:SPOR domain-containing protein n=1 Tax=Novosphingobium sp. MMS21-SN21R TaxID=2969298 RepID=UPI0028872A7C|nr:SPOR domain-containing protein [Novosphingobium sp. MMS21-SN21R]MDT0506876.1 SPOR domain-containing protein [Novosphingobium sp. MMS21-SN21R]